MNFESVTEMLNKLLAEKKPLTFDRAWIREHAPRAYRFIQREIRHENGGIDWDRITRALNTRFQKNWIGSLRMKSEPYRNKSEVNIVLRKYSCKLHTFIVSEDKNDEYIRDVISIALVRLAQKGNISAKQEVIKLLRFTIDDWIEQNPKLSRWRGYEDLILARLDCCIRCYRYSGSFIRYIFKTLEYAARGLKPLFAYSMDDIVHQKKWN